MNLNFFFFFNCEKSISHQHTIFISAECPFHTLGLQVAIFQEFYRTTKVNRSTKQVQLQISKNHKKTIRSEKQILALVNLIIDQFYLLISLEEVWYFIR